MIIKEFLKQQIEKLKRELEQHYIDRSRSSIETEGSYDILIDRTKRELNKLETELKDLENPQTPSEKTSSNTDINTLIAKGQIEEAIQLLLKRNSDNQLILLSAQYNGLKQQHNTGTISHDNYTIGINRITNSLLNFLTDF